MLRRIEKGRFFTLNTLRANVELTTNLNQITRRVTDCAGNTSTTNIAVTLDYSGGISVVVFCYDEYEGYTEGC